MLLRDFDEDDGRVLEIHGPEGDRLYPNGKSRSRETPVVAARSREMDRSCRLRGAHEVVIESGKFELIIGRFPQGILRMEWVSDWGIPLPNGSPNRGLR